jgi:hypothetical protein
MRTAGICTCREANTWDLLVYTRKIIQTYKINIAPGRKRVSHLISDGVISGYS